MIKIGSLLTGLLIFAFSSVSFSAERAKVNIMCKPTSQKLVYDCMIKLMSKKSGAPLEGAMVMIKSDMPSMAMAHNVPIVHALKGDKPGHYKARLNLQMHGDWVLTIDISGPFRDRVIKKLKFGGPMVMKHQRKR
jgi:hypothetical protein